MVDDGYSFPSLIQLQFRRARVLCARNSMGQLFQDNLDSNEPARPEFIPVNAGADLLPCSRKPVLRSLGPGGGNALKPITAPHLKKQNSSAQVALSVEQQVVERKACGLKPNKSKPFRLAVRLSENERQHVVRQAEESCLTLSEYFRASILGPEFVSNIDPVRQKQLQDISRELGRQGNNLNQIAKHLNGGTASPEQGDSMLAMIARSLLSTHMAVRHALAEGRVEY